ncbi:hypothetical protein [Streptomyces sp. NPDC013489]
MGRRDLEETGSQRESGPGGQIRRAGLAVVDAQRAPPLGTTQVRGPSR